MCHIKRTYIPEKHRLLWDTRYKVLTDILKEYNVPGRSSLYNLTYSIYGK